MSPFRLCPCALSSLRLLLDRFPLFLSLAWAPMLVSLLAEAVAIRHPMMGGFVDMLARGAFAAAWVRYCVLDEVPDTPLWRRLGRREIMVAATWLLAETFVTFPAGMLAASLSVALGVPSHDLLMPMSFAATLALGAAYLMPVEAALEEGRGSIGWRFPDLVMRAALPLGMAAGVVWLPINVLEQADALLPDWELAEGFTLRMASAVIDRYPAMALMSGTMALAWRLLVNGPDAKGGKD